MKNKLNSKMFLANLRGLKDFMANEIENLKTLNATNIEAYRSRVNDLTRNGFNIHSSQFTNEPMSMTFGAFC